MNIEKLKAQRAQLAASLPALREQVENAKANLAHHGGAIQALDAVIAQEEAEAQAADIPHTETVEPVTPAAPPAARKLRKPRAAKTAPGQAPYLGFPDAKPASSFPSINGVSTPE